MCDPITATALVITATGAITSTVGGIKGAAAARKAEKAQSRLQSLRTARERTQQLRQAHIEKGRIVAASANAGSGESSGAVAGAAGAGTRANQNIAFINAQEGYGQAISRARQEGINAAGITSLGEGISAIGGVVGNNSETINDIFA